jgi:hypothetical protein
MSTALEQIEAFAQFDGDTRFVFLRVAPHGEFIYIDLGDEAWRAIEIDADGWRIVAEPPVRFRRTKGMLALPVPLMGGTLEELRNRVNLDDDTFTLAIGWLLQALRGRGPYPVLAYSGEQGIGKSTGAEFLVRLVDPRAAPLRTLPRDVRDLAIAANNSYVLCFDNISGFPADIADALCRLGTGGGFATRQLFTDDEERIFEAMRPIILTSIVDVATRADLADRTLVVLLKTIMETQKKTEEVVREKFEQAAPHILGALLDAIAHGLKHETSVVLNRLPRMADHAKWVRACEGAFQKAGTHLDAYDRNRADATEIVLEADRVGAALRRYMEGREQITTTSSNLLDTLGDLVPETVRRSKEWPGNARALGGKLRNLAPALRMVGIYMLFERDTARKRDRLITITTKKPETPDACRQE